VPLVVSHVVTPVAVPARWQSYVVDVDEQRIRQAEARLAGLSARLKGSIECEAVVSIGRPADSLAAIADDHQAAAVQRLAHQAVRGELSSAARCSGRRRRARTNRARMRSAAHRVAS
jgi:malate synthase